MAWSLDRVRGVWTASEYDDLQYAEINNLAEYGEPFSPYEPGFIQDYDPDFAKITIEMPQTAVMTVGYGSDITAAHFPVVNNFLSVTGSALIPVGSYRFDDLVRMKFATEHDRWYSTTLYGNIVTSILPYGITRRHRDIDPIDAAYIHGSVSFALIKQGTIFTKTGTSRRVEAEIGAGNDNWDFNSASVPAAVNATVAAIAGPDHYNLEKPISIIFTGRGKLVVVENKSVTPASTILRGALPRYLR